MRGRFALPILWQSWFKNWGWLALVVPSGTGVFLCYSGDWIYGFLFIGVGVGAFLRDLGRIISIARFWPVNEEVLDWPKVEQLLKENAPVKK